VTIEKKSQAEKRKGEYAQIYADLTKSRRILQFQPKKSLADSIESLRKWYAGHPDGYEL
jgi:UDP-glucose 4-epimerase